MKLHRLKTDINPLIDVMFNEKKAEFRNLDRIFHVGDLLELIEYPRKEGKAARSCLRKITHIQTGFGIPDGFGVLSIGLPTAEEKRFAKGQPDTTESGK